jgi:hypothetical protein
VSPAPGPATVARRSVIRRRLPTLL